MLLPAVTDAIRQAPDYITGISFSDRSIRFIEVEKHKDDVLTLSAYGQLTIPYDVVENGNIINMIEFTETLRRLNGSIDPRSRIVIRKDGDQQKIDALAFAGHQDVHTKEGIDSLRGVFIPWQADAKRICIFANYDTTFVLHVTGYETALLGKITKEELFSPQTGEVLRSYLEGTTDTRVLLAGKYEDDSYIEQLNLYGLEIEETVIWKNLFDFSRYVPEIPQDDSYQYTVPAGLVVAGLMGDTQEVAMGGVEHNRRPAGAPTLKHEKQETQAPHTTESSGTKPVAPLKKVEMSEKKVENFEGGLADLLADVKPLTKLDEDRRRGSEKKMSRKYSKLL